MKSRIIPAAPEMVLSYGIGDKSEALTAAADSLGIEHRVIPPEMAGESVGFLAGYGGFSSNGSKTAADGECVIFSGISGKRLDAVLKAIRENGATIPLKAIVTEHNQSKSVEWLLAELSKEHDAIMKAKRA